MLLEPTRRQILCATVATVTLPVLLDNIHFAAAADADADGWLPSIKPDALADGTFVPVNGAKIILARQDHKITALSRICTHKQCAVKPSKKKAGILICPCHNAEYNLAGEVVTGPAKEPLPHHAIRLVNGTIAVHVKNQVAADAPDASLTLSP